MKKKYETPFSLLMNGENIPTKYKDEMDQIFTTAGAIHGEGFVQHLKFIVNVETLISVMTSSSYLKDEVDPEQIRDIVATVSSQLVASHGAALDLDRKQQIEAIQLCKTMRGVVSALEREMNTKKS